MPVWHNPNTGETFDDFGSFNEPDARWCPDCANADRDQHPLLELFEKADEIEGPGPCTECRNEGYEAPGCASCGAVIGR